MKVRGIHTILTYHYAFVTLIPFLLIMVLSLAVIFPRERDEAVARHRQIAAVIDEKLESFLAEQISELTHINLHLEIRTALQLELDRLVDASDAINVLSYVSTAGIIQKTGLSFDHDDPLHADLEGMDLSGSDVFKKVSAQKKPVWSEAFLSVLSGGPAIAYALPHEDGYLICEISLQELGRHLDRLVSTDGSLFFITDRSGQIITAKNNQLDSAKINLKSLSLFQKTSQSHTRTDSFSIDGKMYLGTLTSLKSLGWYSLLATPKEVVLHNAYNSTGIILSGLLAALLLAALSSRLLLKKFSGQFERLAEHAREVVRTGEKANKPEDPILEFRQITENLDAMAAAVKEREDSLLDALQFLRQNSILFESLYGLSRKEDAQEQEILDFALEAALKVTESPLGYLYLLDETGQVLTRRTWLKDESTDCPAPGPPMICQLAESGLWGEAVRRRQAVITNDHDAVSPVTSGLPTGLDAICRHVSLPVFYQDKIVLLAGVGNKLSDYMDTDSRNIGLIMDAAWLLVQKNRDALLLRASEERSLQMFQQNDDAIVFFSFGPLRPLDANPAALTVFMATDGDVKQLSPRRIFSRKDLHTLFAAIKTGKQDVFIERLNCRRSNGDIFTASIKANIITIDSNKVLFCSFRDISVRVSLEAEVLATQAKMIQANKMTSLGLLVSSVAHEINNPNQSIGMNSFLLRRIWKKCAALLEKCHQDDADLRIEGMSFPEVEQTVPQLIDTMAESSRRIDGYIKELLDFVRKRKEGEADVIDVNRVIKSAVSILWYQIRTSTEQFSTDLSVQNLLVSGNSQQLEQVVINMITNALQSLTSQAGAVSVTTGLSADGNEVIIRFRDEGKGMDRETIAKLAEPFFSTRHEAGGTGLGVYIATNIIKELNGTITYDSEPLRGTTVTVRLPAAATSPEYVAADNSREDLP